MANGMVAICLGLKRERRKPEAASAELNPHQEEACRLRVPDSQIFLNGDKQGRQRGARHVVQEKQQRNKSRPRQGCPERHGNIFRGHETLLTVISCTIAASSLKGQTADEGPGEEAP